MEGKSYTVKVFDNAMDFVRNPSGALPQTRLPVDGLTILQYDGGMEANEEAGIPEDASNIREIDIPDELVNAAHELVRSKIALNGMKDVFDRLNTAS